MQPAGCGWKLMPKGVTSLSPHRYWGNLRRDVAESNAAGLVVLASSAWPDELPATFAFWRTWVRLVFRSVCHSEAEPGASWRELPPPSEEALSALVASAPPMVGLEFVTVASLKQSWRALCDFVADAALADPAGPMAWIHRVNPLGHLVGKVTFHLAENKRDPERPFAFLATFAHKLSEQSRPQHRPLADALKQSVEQKDVKQLERLLEPVRRAAEQSRFVAELLQTKRLFVPQAWTAAEAYRFLQDSPAMEAAGVVIRLPNWWSPQRPPRPRVEVKIGERQPSSVGYASLLDFHAEIVIDGEPLTPDEVKRLLSDAPGLSLLRGKWVEVDQDRLRQALDHWRKISREHPNGIDLVAGMRMLAGVQMTPATTLAENVNDWSAFVAGDWMRTTLKQMRMPDEAVGCQPGRDLNATLRPYQADGVRWLWFMTELGLGACLADDMGLGKTIQVLDLLLQRKRATGKKQVPPAYWSSRHRFWETGSKRPRDSHPRCESVSSIVPRLMRMN